MNDKFFGQLGVSISGVDGLNVDGWLLQGVDPQSSDLFSTHYKVKSQQALLEGKLFTTCSQKWHPYVLVGVGVARNKAYAYTTSVPPFLTFTPMFQNNTTTTFAYRLGLGLDAEINTHWRAGVSVHHLGAGRADLGAGILDTAVFPRALKSSKLELNDVLFQITYLA